MSTDPALMPFHLPAAVAPPYDLGDHRGHIRMTAFHTGGSLLLSDLNADPGAHVTPHIHHREDETFVIQAGRFEIRVGEIIYEAGPDDTVFAPRDIIHAWRCVSPEGGRMLVLITPGTNFEAFGRAMAERRLHPALAMTSSETAAAFIALCAEYGIEMLPPTA